MIVCSVMISTFFRYASSQSMGSAARAALTHLKGQSDNALINPRDNALNIQTWSVRSILEITVWLILAKESRIFCARIVQNHEKTGKMQENVNRRRRNGRFLCDDDIHHRAVSRNAENMTQLMLFWGISHDFPMSCWLKPRYFDTARTIRRWKW